MDVNTGAVLAMAMYPTYDPANPPRDDLDKLNELMRLTVLGDVYEPGSTFKMLTASAAIDRRRGFTVRVKSPWMEARFAAGVRRTARKRWRGRWKTPATRFSPSWRFDWEANGFTNICTRSGWAAERALTYMARPAAFSSDKIG